MVVHAAPSPRQPSPGRSEPDDSEFGSDAPETMTVKELTELRRQTARSRAAPARRSDAPLEEQLLEPVASASSRDPSPAEIAAMCAEIRKGWSEAEHRRRAAGYERPEDSDTRNAIGFVLPATWTAPVCRMAMTGKGVRG